MRNWTREYLIIVLLICYTALFIVILTQPFKYKSGKCKTLSINSYNLDNETLAVVVEAEHYNAGNNHHNGYTKIFEFFQGEDKDSLNKSFYEKYNYPRKCNCFH